MLWCSGSAALIATNNTFTPPFIPSPHQRRISKKTCFTCKHSRIIIFPIPRQSIPKSRSTGLSRNTCTCFLSRCHFLNSSSIVVVRQYLPRQNRCVNSFQMVLRTATKVHSHHKFLAPPHG